MIKLSLVALMSMSLTCRQYSHPMLETETLLPVAPASLAQWNQVAAPQLLPLVVVEVAHLQAQ